MKRTHVVVLAAFVMSATLMTGCPDNGIIRDGLVIVDDFPLLGVVDLIEGFMSFWTGADSPLQVGDLVVGSEKGGFLRRLLALGESGSEVYAETEFASLSEAIENGLMADGIQFSTDDFINAGLIPEGGTTLLDLSGTDIYRGYGVAVTIENGTLNCAPEVFVGATWDDHQLSTFDMDVSGVVTLDLDVRLGVDEQTPVSFETDLIPPITAPFATSIGPIPVVGAAKLRFPAGVVGYFQGDTSIQAGFDISNAFTVNASYVRDVGWEKDADLFDFTANGHEPIWSIEIGATATLYIKVIVEVSLYESAELGAWVKPYLTADLSLVPAPQSLVLTGGIDAGAWYGLSIFDYQILGDSFTWTGPSEVLWEGSTEAD